MSSSFVVNKTFGSDDYIQESLIGLPKALNLIDSMSGQQVPYFINKEKKILL